MHKLGYRPDIDGLRALAVLLVVLFHAGLGFPGGFVGVDAFFVISGYLITGQILDNLNNSSFSLSQFWMRRVRRILPASIGMVFFTLSAGFLLLLPQDYQDLAKSAIYQQLMLANVYFWQTAGYFDGPSELKPLLHMWSLAVEEQFYLFFPPLLAFLHRRVPKLTFGCLLLLFLGSLLLSQAGVLKYRTPAFYLLPTRAWELLTGSLLWWLPTRSPKSKPNQMLANIGALAAMGTLLTTAWKYSQETLFPGFAAIPPCFATAVLIVIHSHCETPVSKLLSDKGVVFVGLVSYSWYLWHWPLFAFSRYLYGFEFSFGFATCLVLGSFLVACGSYFAVETPFRKGVFRTWTTKKLLFSVASSALATFAAATAIIQSSGAEFRFPEKIKQMVFKQKGAVLAEADGMLFLEPKGRLAGVGKSHEINPDDSIDFMVWGDSHARMLFETIDEFGRKHGLQGIVATRSGIGPFPGVLPEKANQWNSEILKIAIERKIPKILLVGKWDDKLKSNKKGEQQALLDLIGKLKANRSEVSLLKQVPRQNFDPTAAIARAIYFGYEIPRGISRSQLESTEKPLDPFFELAAIAGVELIELNSQFFDESGLSYLGNQKDSYYWDDDHLSPIGVRELLGPSLEKWLGK